MFHFLFLTKKNMFHFSFFSKNKWFIFHFCQKKIISFLIFDEKRHGHPPPPPGGCWSPRRHPRGRGGAPRCSKAPGRAGGRGAGRRHPAPPRPPTPPRFSTPLQQHPTREVRIELCLKQSDTLEPKKHEKHYTLRPRCPTLLKAQPDFGTSAPSFFFVKNEK